MRTAAAGGAIGLAGCMGGNGGGGEDVNPADLEVPPSDLEDNVNVWNWYDGWVDWAVEEFESEYETSVSTAAYSNPSEWYTQLEAGNEEIDSISATSAWVVRSMNNDFLHPLPAEKMEGWDALNDLARSDAEEYYSADGNVYAIPETIVAHPLTYSTDYFDEDPGSWDVLWESDLDGMVSMQDWGEVACRVAALYTGQDPNDPDDFDELEEVLIQQKDLNNTYWQDHSTVLQMFDNEEIVAAVYTDGRTYDGQFNQDIPIDMSNTQEGFMYTYDTFVIPQGAPNPRAAVAWTDFGSKPANTSQKAPTMGYVAPIDGLEEELSDQLSEEELEFLQWPQSMSDNAMFIEPLSDELREQFDQIWTNVKAA
ncbi:ABC transporter substrate-binding protein [Halopenitus persicus]|uniref:ABC transporter substrate-binding protein n=1 Tax=Halopenitus persicus TaxID=1048396 RepID=UPI0018EEA954|nr:PotD/PotF family extracellular solute-binding protein [Halopenitus persicus]